MTSMIVTSFPCFTIVVLGLFESTDNFGSDAESNGSFAGISLLTGTALSGLVEVSWASGDISTGAESIGGIGVFAVGSWGLSGTEFSSEIWFSALPAVV